MKALSKKTRLLLSFLAALSVGSMAPAADEASSAPDSAEQAKSPLDQSNKPEDLKITQAIRKAVIADDSLSMAAKNIKIITADGQVTLRGTVNNSGEKTSILAHAKKSAGSAQIVNHIEIKASRQEQ